MQLRAIFKTQKYLSIYNPALKYRFTDQVKKPPSPSGIHGAKLSQQELDKLMNPLGFLQEAEQGDVQAQISKAKELKELISKFKAQKENEKQEQQIPYELDKNGMPPEVGFKVKGLEPTRYGDWIGRGRLTDF